HHDCLAGLSDARDNNRKEIGGGAGQAREQQADDCEDGQAHGMHTRSTPTPCRTLTSHQAVQIMRFSTLQFDESGRHREATPPATQRAVPEKGYGLAEPAMILDATCGGQPVSHWVWRTQ